MITADILVRKEAFSLHKTWPLRHFDETTQSQMLQLPTCTLGTEMQPIYNLNVIFFHYPEYVITNKAHKERNYFKLRYSILSDCSKKRNGTKKTTIYVSNLNYKREILKDFHHQAGISRARSTLLCQVRRKVIQYVVVNVWNN